MSTHTEQEGQYPEPTGKPAWTPEQWRKILGSRCFTELLGDVKPPVPRDYQDLEDDVNRQSAECYDLLDHLRTKMEGLMRSIHTLAMYHEEHCECQEQEPETVREE